MTGLLPLAITMTDHLVRFGYVEIELVSDCLFGQSGEVIRGHSFHYSTCSPHKEIESLYRVRYTLSGREELEGFRSGSMLGSYLHLHFLSNPSFAENFLAQARLKMEVPRS
jgi:cobyrinic acid a,c-diamide synthase